MTFFGVNLGAQDSIVVWKSDTSEKDPDRNAHTDLPSGEIIFMPATFPLLHWLNSIFPGLASRITLRLLSLVLIAGFVAGGGSKLFGTTVVGLTFLP